jgi:cob(I)alamin adenosyltransferase
MTIKQTTPEKQGLIYHYVDLIGQCDEKNSEMQYALEYALKFVPNKQIKRWIELTQKQIIDKQTNIA